MIDPKVIDACARAAHEANRSYCIAIGDTSVAPWEHATTWQRESIIIGVRDVLEQGNGPRQCHESWLRSKLADGWEYGATKDPEKKTHPSIVVYDALPPTQRVKDALFVATVLAVANALGVAPPARIIMAKGEACETCGDVPCKHFLQAMDHLAAQVK